ncbi:MAG: hypothetical protein EA367_07735 [Leptolyngbya sp. DLM2.Bin15]|nr:MAG: hypothetical protein EA367_07735 [Leptolyngbya sp. DLM2.Bin15]
MLAHLIQKRKPLLPFGVAIAVSLGLGAVSAAPTLALSPSSIRLDSQDGVDVELEPRNRRRSPIELNQRDGRLDVDLYDRRRPETDVRIQGNDDSFGVEIERREPEPLLRFGVPLDERDR